MTETTIFGVKFRYVRFYDRNYEFLYEECTIIDAFGDIRPGDKYDRVVFVLNYPRKLLLYRGGIPIHTVTE